MRARLVPVDDAPLIELAGDVTLVGRAEICDAVIDLKSVSKLHCILVKTDGLVLVRDLGSTNGTRVNGTRVRRAALLPGDHFAVAGLRYRLRFGDQADSRADATLPPAPPVLDKPDGSGEEDALAPAEPVRGPAAKRNELPDGAD